MKCTVKNVPSPENITREEWDRIAKQNLENIEALMASESFVSLCHDPIPADGLEEGTPIRWGDKHHAVPLLPHGDNDSFEIGCSSAGLE